jgi:hypothetical protein
VKRFLSAALLAVSFLPAASYAQVYVHDHPPAVIVEHRGPRPHAGWVWTPGYHRWDGAHYAWVGGAWVEPPHPHAVWVAHRWEHRSGGWVMVEGHWR